MKHLNPFCVSSKSTSILLGGLFFFLVGFAVKAQGPEPGHRSIHQLELERHRDYVPEVPQVDHVIPLMLRKRSAAPDREIFGYHPYWMGTAYQNYNYSLLTTIAYFSAEVTSTGYIANLHGWPNRDLINGAHANGVRVVLVATLFDSDAISRLLSSASYRTRLIKNLLQQVENASADGVNIDFEGVPSTQRNNLVTFMRALTDSFHAHIPGSYVTMATPAVNWRNAFDYARLAHYTDGLFIMGYDYHWKNSSSAGPVSPLAGWGTYNVTWTVNDYLRATGGDGSKIILGLPYYGYEWPTVSGTPGASTRDSGSSARYSEAEPKAEKYGKLRDSVSKCPWYRWQVSGGWYQGWYDDSLSLSAKYELAINKNLKGVGIWALGYDGSRPELWGALAEHFGSSAPPLEPTHFRVLAQDGGLVRIECRPSTGATSYRVYHSLDGHNFELLGDFPNPQMELWSLEPRKIHFFKLTAANGNGESSPTEVLAAVPDSAAPRVLIVNGFDRMSEGGNTRDFVIQHGGSIWRAGLAFSSTSNEAVEDSLLDLCRFAAVDWILGEEGTADETFSDREQRQVKRYLRNGGRLFVTGSEIGWDLEAKGNPSDISFYHNFLKAEFVRDKVADWTVEGVAGSIFDGLAFAYDDGTHGIYSVSYPDGIRPVGGSRACLRYNADYVAGVQFEGTFPDGTAPGKLVYLGIPFETIYPQAPRDSVMSRVFRFFNVEEATGVEHSRSHLPRQLTLYPAYPNPFNSSVAIRFQVPAGQRATLEVLDALGRHIRTLWQAYASQPVNKTIRWDAQDDAGHAVSSGVYLVVLRSGNTQRVERVSLLK